MSRMAHPVKEHPEGETKFVRDGSSQILLSGGKAQTRNQHVQTAARSEPDPEGISRFGPKRKAWKLFLRQLPGIICTIGLLAIYMGILKSYDTRSVTRRGKITFNTLSVAAMIALGLSFFGAFKTIAKVARWRFLVGKSLKPREADLILGADSLTNVFQLMIGSWQHKPGMAAVAAGWLLLNFAAQVVVAMIGLNTTMNNGDNSEGITVNFGTVMVRKLDHFYPREPTLLESDQSIYSAVAHTFGENILIQEEVHCRYYGDVQDIKDRQNCTYFAGVDSGPVREFAVRFPDYSPDDVDARNYPFLDTGRFLTVNATNCYGRDATYRSTPDPSGPAYNLTFPFGRDGAINISISAGDMGPNATEYIWHGSQNPGSLPDVSNETCGPRCVYLYAVRDFWTGSSHNVTTYQCEIRVSEVSNATDQVHMVPPLVARTAAAAIALTGQPRTNTSDPNVPSSAIHTIDWDQSHSYPRGADWAAEDADGAFELGERMARFAAAALGTMALRNPNVTTQGMVPQLGNILDVKWPYVWGLAGGIVAGHILLVLLMLFLVRNVVVPDDSALVVGRLLRDVTGGLQNDEEARLDKKDLANDMAYRDAAPQEDHSQTSGSQDRADSQSTRVQRT